MLDKIKEIVIDVGKGTIEGFFGTQKSDNHVINPFEGMLDSDDYIVDSFDAKEKRRIDHPLYPNE